MFWLLYLNLVLSIQYLKRSMSILLKYLLRMMRPIFFIEKIYYYVTVLNILINTRTRDYFPGPCVYLPKYISTTCLETCLSNLLVVPIKIGEVTILLSIPRKLNTASTRSPDSVVMVCV